MDYVKLAQLFQYRFGYCLAYHLTAELIEMKSIAQHHIGQILLKHQTV